MSTGKNRSKSKTFIKVRKIDTWDLHPRGGQWVTSHVLRNKRRNIDISQVRTLVDFHPAKKTSQKKYLPWKRYLKYAAADR